MSALACRSLNEPIPRDARLLTDANGAYGITVDIKAPTRFITNTIVLQPEKIMSATTGSELPTLFQMVPHKKVQWARGAESALIGHLHGLMLAERGITPEKIASGEHWRTYHGLRRSSTRIINSLLCELYATIPPEVLRVVRRYPFSLRSDIYTGLCQADRNALQLADAFPYLALEVYRPRQDNTHTTAQGLVRRGARLQEVAEAVNVPMELKRFKPMVMRHARHLGAFLHRHKKVVAHHCPHTVPQQREWLGAIRAAIQNDDDDYGVWVAKHFDQIGHWRDVAAIVGDYADWVTASRYVAARASLNSADVDKVRNALNGTDSHHLERLLAEWWNRSAKQQVGRAFNSKMSPPTVSRLSEEWHDRQAQMAAIDYAFPKPWYDGDTINGYSIVPIKAADELSRYAYQLHNCGTSYSAQIAGGDCFLYVIADAESKPLAMAELVRGKTTQLQQLKGPCNSKVAKSMSRAVRTWLNRQKRLNGNGRMPKPNLEVWPPGCPF